MSCIHVTGLEPEPARLHLPRTAACFSLGRPSQPCQQSQGTGLLLHAGEPDVASRGLQIWKGRAFDSWQMYVHRQNLAAIHTWDTCLGPAGLGPLPEHVHYVCCSQFVVDRSSIRRRPKAFYQAALGFMRNNTLQDIRHVTKNFILGDVFTMMWPAIFGHNPSYVPQPLCEMYNCQGTTERA